jgi:hypothetical protein
MSGGGENRSVLAISHRIMDQGARTGPTFDTQKAVERFADVFETVPLSPISFVRARSSPALDGE